MTRQSAPTLSRATVAAMTFAAVIGFGSAALAAAATVGKAAPGFTLKDESGKAHALKRYRGRIVVLEWTNPECPFVKRHYKKKTIPGVARAFAGKKVVWLAVNSSYFNKPKQSKAWRDQQRLPYPTLQDPSGAVGRRYGARTTPHIFVIDATGVLRYAGAIDDDPHGDKAKPRSYAHAAVGALLGGKTPDPAATRPYGCSVKYKK